MVATRKRKILAQLLLLLIGIAVAVLVALQRLPELAQHYVREVLAEYGVSSFATVAFDGSLDRAATEMLTVSGLYQGWQFDLTFTDLDARFHWRGLFASKLDQLTVGSLSARIRPPEPEAANHQGSGAVLPLRQWLTRAAAFSSPVDHIRIDSIQVEINAFQPQPQPQLSQQVSSWQSIAISGSGINLSGAQKSLTGHLGINVAGGSIRGTRRIELELEKGSGIPWVPDIEAAIDGDDKQNMRARLALTEPLAAGPDMGANLSFSGNVSSLDVMALLARQFDSTPNSKIAAADKIPEVVANLEFSGAMRLPAEIHPVSGQWMQGIQVDSGFAVTLTTGGWPAGGVEAATLDFSGGIRGESGNLKLVLEQPLILSGDLDGAYWQKLHASFPWSGTTPFQLSLQTTPAVDLHLLAGAVEKSGAAPVLLAEQLSGQLAVGESGQQMRGDIDIQRLQWQPGMLDLAATVRATLFYGKSPLPTITIGVNLQRRQAHWQGEGTVDSGTLKAQGTWQFGFSPGGTVTIASHMQLDSLVRVADELRSVGLYQAPATITAGIATVSYNLVSDLSARPDARSKTNQIVEFSARELAGDYQGVTVAGGTAAGKLALGPSWRSQAPLSLKAASINAGIPLTDISVRLWLENRVQAASRWRLDALEGGLFSGKFSLAEPAKIDIPFSGNRVALMLSGIQLDDIFALYADQGLNGTGELSGRVPVTLASGGVRVLDGLLLSTSPGGRIVYRPPAGAGAAVAAGNEQLGMAMKLLQDFRYDQLRVDANFEPDGQLLLGLSLSGRNPDVYQGRQVNFNINVEENLFDLLKVARISGEVSKKLEKQLQKRQ